MINVTLTNSTCLVLGAVTLLKQFHSDSRNEFIAILAQYIRSSISLSSTQKPTELPAEISKVLNFVEDFLDYSELDRKIVEVYIPKYVMDQFSVSNS